MSALLSYLSGGRRLGGLVLALATTGAAAQPQTGPPGDATGTRTQPGDDPCAAAAAEPGGGGEGLLVTLPLRLIDFLETVDQSPFVHAYLLGLVAQDAAGQHWTSVCSRGLLQAPLADVAALRARVRALPAETLLDQLRTAEEDRQAAVLLRATAQGGARALVESLSGRPTPTAAIAAIPTFEQLAQTCAEAQAGWCDEVDGVVRALEDVREARARVQAGRHLLDQLRACADRAVESLPSPEPPAAPEAARDTTAAPPPEPAPLAVPCPALGGAYRLSELQDHLQTQRDDIGRREGEVIQAVAAVPFHLAALAGSLPVGGAELEVDVQVPAFVAPSASGGALAPPSVAALGGAAAATAGPVDVAGAFVDFVLDRARDESVLYLIVRLSDWMGGDHAAVMQAAFPETSRLMRSLTQVAEGPVRRLRAREAAQIPLSTWRASLAGDYAALPYHLVDQAAPHLCSSAPPAPDGAPAATDGLPAAPLEPAPLEPGCAANLRDVRVALGALHDLLRGHAALTVLERLPRYAQAAAPDGAPGSPRWAATRAGLRIAAALSETHRVQRALAPEAALRYPYLLSAETLAGASPQHRSAFLRLLMLHAGDALVGPGVDGQAFADGVAGTVEAIGRLSDALQTDAPGTNPEVDPRVVPVLRAATDVAASGLDLAAALRPDLAPDLETVGDRWAQVGLIGEALATQNHGLALTRTVTLVDRAAPGRLPSEVLRVSALASELAGARSQDQARAAFAAAASPLGGYDAKRYGDGARVTVTVYPGGVVGQERVVTHDGTWAWAAGVALPVGAEWALWGQGGRCVLVCSAGLFASVLDLGAVLSYRLEGDGPAAGGGGAAVSAEPNVTLAQLFSPGLHVALGVGRTPLTVLLGGQLTPELRDVAAGGATTRGSTFRVGAAVVLDLVLLEF